MSFCFTDIVSFTTHDSTITKILLPTMKDITKVYLRCQQASLSPGVRMKPFLESGLLPFPELMLTQPWLGDLETADIQESGTICQMSSHELPTWFICFLSTSGGGLAFREVVLWK